MPKRKSKRGGKRPGAGRPRTLDEQTVTVSLSADQARRLSRWADEHGVSMRAAADVAVAHLTQARAD